MYQTLCIRVGKFLNILSITADLRSKIENCSREIRLIFFEKWNAVLHESLDEDSEVLTPDFSDSAKYVFSSDLCRDNPVKDKELNLFHLNCRGLNSSHRYSSELVENSRGIDILRLTETWLNVSNESLLDINGYNFYRKNRCEYRHGELAAYVKSDLEVEVRDDLSVYIKMAIKSAVLEVKHRQGSLLVFILYRTPSSPLVRFFELLEELLKKLPISRSQCGIVGILIKT